MADHHYKIGEVVQLRSGGPMMTVEALIGPSELAMLISGTTSSERSYRCQWFNGRTLASGVLPEESLQPAKADGVDG